MPDSSLLSVIVPMHNSASYISRCLNNLLNQAVKSIQIIVVDDCSEDESVPIVEKIARENPAVELHRMAAHGGPGVARNEGKKHAKGEFIAFLDSDDWVDLAAYAETIDTMKRDGSEVGIFGVKNEFEFSSASVVRYHYRRHNVVSGDYALQLFGRRHRTDMPISPLLGNKVFRRTSHWENTDFPEIGYFEDAVFVFMILAQTNRVSFLAENSLHYFQHAGSITHVTTVENIDSLILGFTHLKNKLESMNLYAECKDCYHGSLKHCISSCFAQIRNNIRDEQQQRDLVLIFFNKLSCMIPHHEIMQLVSLKDVFNLFPYP